MRSKVIHTRIQVEKPHPIPLTGNQPLAYPHRVCVLNVQCFLYCSVSTSLPSTIDSTVAIKAFRSQHALLLDHIRHCLPSLASSLFSEFMIPEGIKEKACNQNLSTNERGVAVLDSVQSKLKGEPSDLSKFVVILESEPYLRSQAEQLVKNYCESF